MSYQESFAENELQTDLKKLLPSEEELEVITNGKVWEYVQNNSGFDEKLGIKYSISALLRDITRIYEPINYKFKVPTIMIKITEYSNKDKLKEYWNESKNNTIEELLSKSYLVGSPNDSTDCFFNYTKQGAMTVCVHNNILIQSTIFDKYNEHYKYDSKEIQLDQYEMTAKIMDKILQNLHYDGNIKLFESLQKVNQNEKIRNKSVTEQQDLEKENKFGIQNVSCIQDEFGLITISGQYNNNEIKKDKVNLVISFLDREGNDLVKSSINLNNIKEFENKRFIGNTFWDYSFFTCSIKSK